MKTAKVVGIFTLAICLPYVIGYVHGYNTGLDTGAERTEAVYTKLLQEAAQPRPAHVLVVYMSWHTGMQYVLCDTAQDSLQFTPIKSLTGNIITDEVCSKIKQSIERKVEAGQ